MGSRILSRAASRPQYTLRIASSQADVRAAQTLRFFVFNLELQEGLEASYLTLRDEDIFDAVCDHLLVEHQGEIVGTYRMQTGLSARNAHGFYSAQEFDLRPFEPFQHEILELGRACVHREHRNLHVLGLLWRGIVQYAREHACRYLLGCSSLTSQNPNDGLVVFNQLAQKHLAPEPFRTAPLPQWQCEPQAPSTPPSAPLKVPKLLSAYLSLGARICGAPALDTEFKTIDFLTLLDLESLPPSAVSFLS
jgi:putative hemolysin